MEKLIYSKCPSCNRHGIKTFNKVGRNINRVVVCKYCKKQFRVNWVWSFLGMILLVVFFALCALLLNYVSWLCCVLAVIAWIVFVYLVPMEEVYPPKTPY